MGSNMEIFEARVLGENPKTKIFPQNPCFKYFHVRTHSR
jgi:hypothetical protein